MPLTSRIQNERSIYVSMALKLAHNMVCREPKTTRKIRCDGKSWQGCEKVDLGGVPHDMYIYIYMCVYLFIYGNDI